MFFKKKKEKNKTSEDIKIEIPQQAFQNPKLPIVTLDNSWHQLLENIKTPEIAELEEELNELLKNQGKVNTDYIQYTKMKKEMLDKIMELTPEAFEKNSPDALKQIEDQQKMILKINEELEGIEKDLDSIPNMIKEVNGRLLEKSVNLCYEYMNEYKKASQVLEEEIHTIRASLLQKTEKKKVYDEKIQQLYKYLHQSVGPDFIDKLDKVYLGDKK